METGEAKVRITRLMVAEKIEQLLSGRVSREDAGWWALDLMMEPNMEYEPASEKLLEDALRAIHYFHDTEPIMQQFYPDSAELVYYLKCLTGEEMYQRSRVVHWRV